MPAAPRPQRIVLIGLSGTGKSTVARLIARRLRWRCADTDDEIVARDGRDIPTIFRNDGEVSFRALERAAVARLTALEYLALATGGGAVLDGANRERLWHRALVVHLDTSTDALFARLSGGRHGLQSRPLLEGADARDRLDQLRTQRSPLYSLADLTIVTDGLTPQQVADRVVACWERDGAALVTRSNRATEVVEHG
jgi:shikimate kinase